MGQFHLFRCSFVWIWSISDLSRGHRVKNEFLRCLFLIFIRTDELNVFVRADWISVSSFLFCVCWFALECTLECLLLLLGAVEWLKVSYVVLCIWWSVAVEGIFYGLLLLISNVKLIDTIRVLLWSPRWNRVALDFICAESYLRNVLWELIADLTLILQCLWKVLSKCWWSNSDKRWRALSCSQDGVWVGGITDILCHHWRRR